MSTFRIIDKPAVSSIDGANDAFPVWQGAAQKRATATQLVSSVAPLLISSNTAYNVGAGGDYADINAAITALASKAIAPNAAVTLNLLAGVQTYTSHVYYNSDFFKYVFIQGISYAFDVTSVQSSSGGAGAWSIVLNVSSVANIATGDYVAIYVATGGVNPTYICGCHVVTNVDAGNTRITITSTNLAPTAPSGATAAPGSRVFKTRLQFNGVSGFMVWDGHGVLNINDAVVVGNGTASTVGFDVQDLGRLSCTRVGVVGFATNVFIGGSNTNANYLASSSATGVGIVGGYNAMIGVGTCVVSGNAGAGLSITTGSACAGDGFIATGNGSDGFWTGFGATFWVANCNSTGNVGFGYSERGVASLNPLFTGANNTKGISDYNIVFDSNGLRIPGSTHTSVTGTDYGNGLIFKGGNRWLHDFNYGNNGTVTTEGSNVFMGDLSGNTTMGSTAVATYQSSHNVGLGEYALNALTTGFSCTAVGSNALRVLTSGVYNFAGGYTAMAAELTCNYCVAVGAAALSKATSGDNNVAIGNGSGSYIADGSTSNLTPNTSTYLGAGTKALADAQANQIVIGYNAIGAGANTATLGNTSVIATQLRGVIMNTTYTVATLPSAVTYGAGARAFVTDANAPTFGATVAGSGAVATPVYSDGTNWKVG